MNLSRRPSLLTALSLWFVIAAAPSQTPHSQQAATRLNDLGPENTQLAERAGLWDVVETSWDAPSAQPTTRTLIAQRRMIGPFLEEILESMPNAPAAEIKRIDYLSFNRVEGRWKYLSMDTRVPAGLMPAASFSPDDPGSITLTFDPFALAGPGIAVSGQLLCMQQKSLITVADNDRKDQFFLPSDGTGKSWLGHRYEYTRHRG